jgi:osmotically-inducible protein OsmY
MKKQNIKNIKNSSQICALLLAASLLPGCVAPFVVGGGAAVGALATTEKGVPGVISDSSISRAIKTKFYKHNPDMYSQIDVDVQSGEVLLTGTLTEGDWQQEAENMVRKIRGVKNVFNHTIIKDTPDSVTGVLSDGSKDTWISTQIRSKLLFTNDVQSMNYSITTDNAVVYVMGLAQNQAELDKVLTAISKMKDVKKVVNYVKILGEEE